MGDDNNDAEGPGKFLSLVRLTFGRPAVKWSGKWCLETLICGSADCDFCDDVGLADLFGAVAAAAAGDADVTADGVIAVNTCGI